MLVAEAFISVRHATTVSDLGESIIIIIIIILFYKA